MIEIKMGFNIDDIVQSNKPVVNQNKKKNAVERQTDKALNTYNSIREKIDSRLTPSGVNQQSGVKKSPEGIKTKKFNIV